MTRVERI